MTSAVYDDSSDLEAEEAEPVDTRDRKGVAGSVTSPQGTIPRLPFFKKVTVVITFIQARNREGNAQTNSQSQL